MSDAPVPQPPASPRPYFQAPPTPGSPGSQYASYGPRTPLSPSFRAPLSPRTPLSPRRPSPPGTFYPPTGGLEPPTPHGFVPMRRDSAAPFDPRTPVSATFKEEVAVVKAEEEVTKIDRKDLKVKFRIRIAKVVLRSVNFCCSLVVLALISSALYIFHKTVNLPPRNNLPPWANSSATWPQITLCCIAAVSLVLCMSVLYAYWRGGHRRAEKASIYVTAFSIASFIFAIVMWGIAAGILNGTRAAGNGQDIWGWSCKDNKRKQLFQEDINYALVCRALDWGFVCALIEVSVELFTIGVYAYAFWRIATKRKLRKSMDIRDRARSDLWLAKLREQEAANSDDENETKKNTMYNMSKDPYSAAEEGMAPGSERPMQTPTSGGFQLQAVPKIRHHQPPVSLTSSPQVVQSEWGTPQPQLNSYDPTAIPLPPTPAFAPNQYRQSYAVPPTPASVRFNINPSPPPSRA